MSRVAGAIALSAMLGGTACAPNARDAAAATQQTPIEWTAYAHDAGGTKYSPAAQITRDNVAKLIPVWTYRTGDYGRGGGAARDETTPLYVDGMLYASTPFGGVRAIDPETGSERWAFDADLDVTGDYGDFTNRGVSTWLDPTAPATDPCKRRIFIATVDARLIALDARTGKPCETFGDHGQVHLTLDIVNAPKYVGEYAVTSPPAIYRDFVIVGSSVADNQRTDAPDGVVRAYDARSGARRWSWDPIPRDSGAPGFDTWKGPRAHQTGAANAWSIISVDSARDLAFVPVGSASPDFFGGERLGKNQYANSIVALQASTGRMQWTYQAVHHDLWDYDVPAQPVLYTARVAGKEVPALAQTTKMGFVFLFDRTVGAPLFQVNEVPVPKSDVPGEEAWPTQPVPTIPAPLGPTAFTLDSVFARSDSERASCVAQLRGVRMDGMFTPPSVGGTVLLPGNIGGSNWSGMSIDPVRRIAFIPSNRVITLVALVPRLDAANQRMQQGRLFEFAPQTGTPYAMKRHTPLQASDGMPCNRPPWGVLTAIDLETGAKKWEVPFGRMAALAQVSGSEAWGSPNLGGSMATAGGLVFVTGALDQHIHAYDTDTGRELWSAMLPAGVHAAPMTYANAAGRQFIVVAAGGHKDLGDKLGDFIVAFALPGATPPVPAKPLRIVAGKYAGHMILDRSWVRAAWDLTLADTTAKLAFTTERYNVHAAGTGRLVHDTLTIDAKWNIPERNCGGTMKLVGTSANDGSAIIGEVDYFDGCADQRNKLGTFAVYRGARNVTSLAH